MKLVRCVIYLLAVVATPLLAQGQESQSTLPPFNPDILTGKLDNGLTYYIMQNKEPEKRASFYLIQNVGSLVENDDQNGLAHFLEHMAFNGTQHFPETGIISMLEKHGVAFGYNINAYTAFNETVYNLSDVPVDDPGLLDTCLLVLHDWSDFLLLKDEDIDDERGVITEEWRTRRNASFRMMKQYFPVLLKGSKFPERDVIGDLDIIQNFDPETLRNFYHKWYRTDLQAVAIVGDFDPDQMVEKVKELFSPIKAVEDPPERGFFEVPSHNEMLYVHATDKEASQTSIDLYIKSKAIDPAMKDLDYMREQYIRTLFNSMMSKRIGELLQKGSPPFVTGSVSFSGFVRGYNVFSIGASSKKNEDAKAFEAIYTEAERVRRFGFTPGELERAKSTMLTNWESYFKEKDKIDNDTWAGNIQRHFLINEPLTTVDFEFDLVNKLLPGITLEEVSARARDWMTPGNRVLIVQGPDEEGASWLTEEESVQIINKVNSSEIEPYEDIATGVSLISGELTGGKVVSTKNLDMFDAIEWTLSNGARVVFKKSDYEKDQVSLMAYSPGGSSLVEDNDIPNVEMLPAFAPTYGAGDWDAIALQKMLSGKKASVTVSTGEVTDNINGSSSPDDLETMLQLLYLKFEKPRFDAEAHQALLERYTAFLTMLNNNPQKVIQDSVTRIMSDYHPRARILDTTFLQEVSFDRMKEIYLQRYSDADDYTFFLVGNIDKEKAKPLVEKYIGSLTSREGSEEWIDRKVNAPEGITKKDITMLLQVPKATVMVNWDKKMDYSARNRQALRVLNGILDIIYNETIREEEGGTYGVSVSLSLQHYPVAKAAAMVMFDCDPERSESLKEIVYNQIEKLRDEGPSQEHLDKAVNNILKTREESKSHNSYWMSVIYGYYYNGIDYNDPANYEEILKSFSPDDIRRTANELFGDSNVIDLVFRSATK